MEDDPAAVGGEVIGDARSELFPLEERLGLVSPLVVVLGDLGAPGVAHRVDPHFHLVDEAEEGLQQHALQEQRTNLLPHQSYFYHRPQQSTRVFFIAFMNKNRSQGLLPVG